MTQSALPNRKSYWMNGYQPQSGYFDEYLTPDGSIRPRWKDLSKRFQRITKEAWAQRERQLERTIHDNGITYNVYSDDPDSGGRPWQMDMVPFVVRQSEMDKIQSALAQRAQLLNLVLSDVYGRQTLLQSGKMHPYLIFANPAFLRSCHSSLSGREPHLHMYSADLARSPDGSWWVLNDRVEAASGLGYALENRALTSRIFPKIMQETDILPLKPFVRDFCRYFESLAQQRSNVQPSIAMLTAGPKNETYFEQSFIARNLGYSLVEGGDLAVRDGRLCMKTVSGVQPVDVLLRRVDSQWCDPLELRNDSLLGIPGLVNTVRNGNVTIANALGSGFVETPALLAFLPWLARNLLGEHLEMPSVATWWCGQPAELAYVLDNLDKLAIKPTFRDGNAPSYFGPKLTAAQKSDLVTRIRKRPELYCGQEIVAHSMTPTYHEGHFTPRHFQMRVFLVRKGNDWTMMPGGLARSAPDIDTLSVSMQQGGESKDVWAIRDQADGTFAPAPEAGHLILSSARPNANDLPSRTADNLFWLGRYSERAESRARLMRALCNLLIEESGNQSQLAALPFIEQLTDEPGDAAKLVRPRLGLLKTAETEAFLLDAIFGSKNYNSLTSTIRNIERSANTVKERLSLDTLKRIQTLRDHARQSREEKRALFDEGTLLLLDRIVDDLASFAGNIMENMTRSHGWRFLQLGRRIERGQQICSLLGAAFTGDKPFQETLLNKLLLWADSSISYRRRYLNHLQADAVLDLLCFDTTNPRSLAFQAESVRDLLADLPHRSKSGRHSVDQIALRLYSRIGLNDPASLLAANAKGPKAPLAVFMRSSAQDFMELSVKIEQTYFAHTERSKESRPETFLG